MEPDLYKIDNNHFLCTYRGADDDGWAVILTVDTDNWIISKETPYEFDNNYGKDPAISKIDNEHYLCAFESTDDDGWAVVLIVDQTDWTISSGPQFEYDTSRGTQVDLLRIDNDHHLGAYSGPGDDGISMVLTVDTSDWTISKGQSFAFDPGVAEMPALIQIQPREYLCLYTGQTSLSADDGWSVILRVKENNWKIKQGSKFFEWDIFNGETPSVAMIDNEHYLCTYDGPDDDGWAAIIKLDLNLEP